MPRPIELLPEIQYALRAAFLFGGVKATQRQVQHYLGGEPAHWHLSLVPAVTLQIDEPIRPVLLEEAR